MANLDTGRLKDDSGFVGGKPVTFPEARVLPCAGLARELKLLLRFACSSFFLESKLLASSQQRWCSILASRHCSWISDFVAVAIAVGGCPEKSGVLLEISGFEAAAAWSRARRNLDGILSELWRFEGVLLNDEYPTLISVAGLEVPNRSNADAGEDVDLEWSFLTFSDDWNFLSSVPNFGVGNGGGGIDGGGGYVNPMTDVARISLVGGGGEVNLASVRFAVRMLLLCDCWKTDFWLSALDEYAFLRTSEYEETQASSWVCKAASVCQGQWTLQQSCSSSAALQSVTALCSLPENRRSVWHLGQVAERRKRKNCVELKYLAWDLDPCRTDARILTWTPRRWPLELPENLPLRRCSVMSYLACNRIVAFVVGAGHKKVFSIVKEWCPCSFVAGTRRGSRSKTAEAGSVPDLK